MLSILHPEIIPIIQDYSSGLYPIFGLGISPKLIIKTVKESILAAKINRGFKIYVCPITLAGVDTVSLISAFFDDEDEPLVISTALFDIKLTHLLLEALNYDTLDIHFFDEHNRELLGYVSQLVCPSTTRDLLNNSSYCTFDLEYVKSAFNQMSVWFGNRTHEDDISAIDVRFVETIVPEGQFFIETRPEYLPYHASHQFSFSELERNEPGTFQEQDIARLFLKLFSRKQIYMNPLRITDNEEIADILVITEYDVLVVQAKDSPNIERVLMNSIDRKKATTRKALSKAVKQVSGAIGYLKSMPTLKIIINGETFEIDICKRTLRALIVVKELFKDEYSLYSPPILELSKEIHIPCIAIDYSELIDCMKHLHTEDAFFEAFDIAFKQGFISGQFPRFRFL